MNIHNRNTKVGLVYLSVVSNNDPRDDVNTVAITVLP